MQAEKYKPKLVAKFIINSDLAIEALYNKIKSRIKDLKECFEEDVIKEYDDDFLSWMLFFDGCSTLQFISSYDQGHELLEVFSLKTDQVAYAQQDLFLLRNQIPFFSPEVVDGVSQGLRKAEEFGQNVHTLQCHDTKKVHEKVRDRH
ncbi:hypothetical protein TIFTF001_024624 [Ficus carica]|uniref:Uncharacterized protein n=1 Tax=Ficus carica TaxID=3494 RepID=A0AA88AH47_FICCA|nr:hypothetical protein TIFTF001_024624 [Ficus carica]